MITKAFLRYLRRHPSLTVLQVLGVACGVAAAVGMVCSAQTAFSSFSQVVEFLKGRTTHTIRHLAGPLDESLLAKMMNDPAVEVFAPVIDRRIRLNDGELVRLLGIDPFLDRSLRPHLALSAQAGKQSSDLLLRFLLDERAVAVDRRFLKHRNAQPDTTVATLQGQLTMIGTLTSQSGEPLFIMDIGHAQRFLHLPGQIDYVDLVLHDPEGFQRRWSPGFIVESSGEQRVALSDMLAAFRLNLTALSLLALFVGMFLVYNTSMFAAVSRRKDAGILRSLGATRSEILMAFGAEIILLGSLGGLLGGILGYGLSHALTTILGRTISNLYVFVLPASPVWSWRIPVFGLGLGCGAGLLGGILPIIELLRTDPVQTLHGRIASSSGSSGARAAAAAALGILAASAGLLFLTSRHVYYGLAGAFFFMLGASLFTGMALIGVSPMLRRLLHRAGRLPGRLAADNICRNLGRTGVAIAAFMVALSMIVGLGLMIGSFRHSLIWWMDGHFHGDLYIAPSPEIPVPPAFYEEVRSEPGIAGIDLYRHIQVTYRNTPVYITAIVSGVLERFADFSWFEGGPETWAAVQRGEAIVSESFYRRFGVATGDELTLEGAAGPFHLRIAGVFYDYSTEHGLIMMDRLTYINIYGDETIDSLTVFTDPQDPRRHNALNQVRDKAHAWGLPALTRDELTGGILEVFDSTFAITRSMRVLAVIVAFFGISGAIMILFIERRKEFGIYRSLGFSTAQIAIMTVLESLGMGVISFALSTVVGTGVAVILIKVINFYSFNWTIFYYHQWLPYILAAVTALLACLGAAAYPVARIARTYPQMQIREE